MLYRVTDGPLRLNAGVALTDLTDDQIRRRALVLSDALDDGSRILSGATDFKRGETLGIAGTVPGYIMARVEAVEPAAKPVRKAKTETDAG